MPPQAICNAYKRYQKVEDSALDQDIDVVDFRRGLTEAQKEKIVPVASVPSELINVAQKVFIAEHQGREPKARNVPEACTVYEHKDFTGQSRIYDGKG